MTVDYFPAKAQFSFFDRKRHKEKYPILSRLGAEYKTLRVQL